MQFADYRIHWAIVQRRWDKEGKQPFVHVDASGKLADMGIDDNSGPAKYGQPFIAHGAPPPQ